MSLPNPYRFVAVRGKDWDGRKHYRIYDEHGDHVATMVWSEFRKEYQCSFHRHDQWGTPVNAWRQAILEVEC